MAEREFRVERTDPRRLHDLRRRVLRGGDLEALVEDPRDDDATTLHLAGVLAERVVVSATFYRSPAPFVEALDESEVSYQLRFMATDLDVQGRGYGARVLEHGESELGARGAVRLWANARDSALGFYRASGWVGVEGSAHMSPETNLAHHVIFKRLD